MKELTVLDTPIKVKPEIASNVLVLWAVLSWLAGRAHPERSWAFRLLSGALYTAVLMLADVGHALAHIVSARRAGAPMDEVQLSAGMPRTIYHDDDVPPRAHRMRAMGGPVFSALGLGVSLLLRGLSPGGSLLHDVASWSSLGHGLIFFGSLAPLPIVDGGALLKWTLVERGHQPAEADVVVRRAGVATGIVVTGAGAVLVAGRRWLPGMGLVVAGLVAIGAALKRVR